MIGFVRASWVYTYVGWMIADDLQKIDTLTLERGIVEEMVVKKTRFHGVDA